MSFPDFDALNTKPVENIGGYRWLKAASVADIASIDYGPDREPIAISFQPDTEWISIDATFESIEFKEASASGTSAFPFTQSVECFFPGNAPAVILELEARIKQRMVVVIADFNEMITVIGSKENGCFLSIDYNSRSRTSGLKGTTLTWRRQHHYRARSIAEAVLF